MIGRSEPQNGSRLDHLVVLRDRVETEIADLERAARVQQLGSVARPATAVLLESLGVTALDVKVWAVDRGHLSAVVRGRVPLLLVEAYAEEHR